MSATRPCSEFSIGMTIRRAADRWIALAVTMVALAWSASRTSWMSAAAVLAALVVVRYVRGRSTRAAATVATVGLAVLGALAVALPFVTPDGSGFNHRAHYWSYALDRLVDERAWSGLGADFFKVLATQPDNLGGHASDAHSFVVQVLVGGGVVLGIAVACLVSAAGVRAVRATRGGSDWPMLFLVAFLVQACLEVPLTFDERVREMPYSVVLLVVLVCGRPLLPGVDTPGREPGRPSASLAVSSAE